MINILVDDIVPIIVIMALGYICGKFSYFDDDQRQGLNKLVLNIALPAALFVSIIKSTRAMLAKDATLTAISFIGVIVMFMVSYYLCRLLFHRSIQEAAVCALIAGSPTIGFLGFAVLDPILRQHRQHESRHSHYFHRGQRGDHSDRHVSDQPRPGPKTRAKFSVQAENAVNAKANAKGDITLDPARDAATDKTAELMVHGTSNMGKNRNGNLQALLDALRQPICWASLLAIFLVLVGIHVPSQVAPTFDLIAKANSGVAVLSAGLALSTVKFSLGWETIWNTFFRLILTPAVFLGVALLCGMGGDMNKISMLVMAVALPPAFSGIIISSRYNIYVKEGASTTAVATVAFAATCLLWIWLVPFCVG